MRHPAALTRGGFLEGYVAFDSRLTPATAVDWLPYGKRAAFLDATGKIVGLEVEVDALADGLWMAAQLDRASRYKEFVEKLLKAGGLSLAALTMPRLATKAYGLVEQPLVGWDLVPLRVPGGTYAVSAADVARRFEEAGSPLPTSTWTSLDAWTKIERTTKNETP